MKRCAMQALAALNLGLIVLLAWLWFDQDGQIRDIRWTAPVAIKPDFSNERRSASVQEPATSMALVLATLERPLLSPSRRPPPVVAATTTAEPPADPLANVLIQGIFSGDGIGGIIARVDGIPKRISINESVGSWTLKGIDERNVTFVRKDETRIVQLVRAKEAPPTAAPTTAGGPAPAQPPGPQAMAAGSTAAAQAAQDAVRERYRRRNEVRARAGLPPVSIP